MTFPADRMVRILFVMSGSLMMEHGDTVRLVTSKQYVCLARGERFVTTAQDDAHVVVLSLIHRIIISAPRQSGRRTIIGAGYRSFIAA